MTFTVDWQPAAQDQLADIRVTVPQDRQAVTRAANRIDQLLRTDPLHVGEARSGVDRILFERPLVVHYMVILDDRKVLVTDVRHV